MQEVLPKFVHFFTPTTPDSPTKLLDDKPDDAGLQAGNSWIKAHITMLKKKVRDLPCTIRRGGGQSLVIGGVIPCNIRRKCV